MSIDRLFLQISQCAKSLDFAPRAEWPAALPAMCWRGIQLSGWDRVTGIAIDLFELNSFEVREKECRWMDAMIACYPKLGMSEFARLIQKLELNHPEIASAEISDLAGTYGFRWCERLQSTLQILSSTPRGFQNWVDDKGLGARDLSPLLAVDNLVEFHPLLNDLIALNASKSQAVQALEWIVELRLMGRTLEELAPNTSEVSAYLRKLEKWRRPRSSEVDEQWRERIGQWPWPQHVQGQWQRLGDQSGLEIKMRATSPDDLNKKLQRLLSIRDSWQTQQQG